MPKTKQAHWTVTAAPGTDVQALAAALRLAGLRVTDVLDVIGVVNGHAPAALAASLRQVPGVADVAPTLGFELGPEGG
jgi:hypothetical protein